MRTSCAENCDNVQAYAVEGLGNNATIEYSARDVDTVEGRNLGVRRPYNPKAYPTSRLSPEAVSPNICM